MDSRLVTTITPNPAIDKTYWIPGFTKGINNRVNRLRIDPGGKAINIARILGGFGIRVKALGFFGGNSGKELLKMLESDNLIIEPIFVQGETRTNIKIIDWKLENETEINEPGPFVTEKEKIFMRQKIDHYAQKSEFLVFAGSLPEGCQAEYYGELILLAKKYGCRSILDTSEAALKESLRFSPYMIKPNHHELSEIWGREISTEATAAIVAEEFRQAYKIEVIVVSLGGKGAVLACKEGTFHAIPPEIKPKNTVGAGDSLVAGIIYGLISGYPLIESLRFGVASGTLAVTELGTSVLSPDVKKVSNFMKSIVIRRLD